MKTFIRLIRRYVLTAIAVVLLFLFLGIGMIVWISWREGQPSATTGIYRQQNR